MKIIFSEKADKDLESMHHELRKRFVKHAEKLTLMPPRRHLSHGIPHHVENVPRQSRLVYDTPGDNTLYIIRCFQNHKEYETWHKNYK